MQLNIGACVDVHFTAACAATFFFRKNQFTEETEHMPSGFCCFIRTLLLLYQVIRRHSLHPSGHEVGHAEDQSCDHSYGEADQGRAHEKVRTGDAEAAEDYGDKGIYQEESQYCTHYRCNKAYWEEGQGQLEPELAAGETHRLFDTKFFLLTDKDGLKEELDHEVNDRYIDENQQQDQQ